MTSESELIDVQPATAETKGGFYDFKLLKTTPYAFLYVAHRVGKRFLIKTTKDNSEAQLRILKREYEQALACDHPHIVHLYTFEENLPVGPAIVMEYVEGRTLGEWLKEQPTKAARRRIFDELTEAVGYLHQRGITHNDLKPENILISRTNDTLKLIDFGLSDSDAEYALRTLGCTPRYASPELRRRERVDSRSDIYSLGLILSELFDGGYRQLVRRCTRLQPADRYADVAALQRAFRRRNNRWKWLVGVVMAALFLLPWGLYTSERMAERQQNNRRETLFMALEQEMEPRFQVAMDSVRAAHFREFAERHVTHTFFGSLPELTVVMLDTITDAEFSAVAWHRYQLLLNDYNERLWQAAKAHPSIDDDSLSQAEQHFYRNLYFSNKPYRPYQAK
ncbi:MAG: serine/threonine protein kinase [Alistipes sp.]|nr:serine/threonine protein kinase [Alistipes sp.]